MSASIPIRFRPTPRQVAGRAVYVGVMTTLVAAVPIAFIVDSPGLMWLYLLVLPSIGVCGGVVAVPLLGRRGGVDVDRTGVSGGTRGDVAPWHRIRDIRAERRGTRTVPVIYLDSGRTWRLPVPYDGPLLSSDPRFDQKLCLLRNTWETYHMWHLKK